MPWEELIEGDANVFHSADVDYWIEDCVEQNHVDGVLQLSTQMSDLLDEALVGVVFLGRFWDVTHFVERFRVLDQETNGVRRPEDNETSHDQHHRFGDLNLLVEANLVEDVTREDSRVVLSLRTIFMRKSSKLAKTSHLPVETIGR